MTGEIGHGDFSIGSEVWPGLAKLQEEMGELNQVLGKLIATHGDVEHWDGDLTPRLVDEISDVLAAIDFFSEINLDEKLKKLIRSRVESKIKLFWRWQAEHSPNGAIDFACDLEGCLGGPGGHTTQWHCNHGDHCVGLDPVCAVDRGLDDHPYACHFCGKDL